MEQQKEVYLKFIYDSGRFISRDQFDCVVYALAKQTLSYDDIALMTNVPTKTVIALDCVLEGETL